MHFFHLRLSLVLRPSLPFLMTLMTLVILASGLAPAAATAQDADEIGLYYDPAYTTNQITIDSAPALVPAYLVLNNPSATTGVGGWECSLSIEGAGTLVGCQLEGSAINVELQPDFRVSIADGPLPGGDQVLLATFNIWVENTEAVVFSLGPLVHASIPNSMAYLDADGSGTFLPMRTATGGAVVAAINGSFTYSCDVSINPLAFPETSIGEQSVQSFFIQNNGTESFELDISLGEDCTAFSLVNITEGPRTLDPDQSLFVTVAFEPSETGYQECGLALNGICPGVILYGTGRDPIIAWSAPTHLDFPDGLVGSTQLETFTVINTGQAPFTIQTSLPDSCSGFRLWDATPHTIEPGDFGEFGAYFEPESSGSFACTMDMGETVPPVLLTASTRDPVISWVVPDILHFGEIGAGSSATLPLVITNTGDVRIDLDISLDPDCTAFSLEESLPVAIFPGQSLTMEVTFTPAESGETSCLLNLGEIIPAITLVGFSLTDGTDFLVTPTAVDFPLLHTGQVFFNTVTFQNLGSTAIHLDTVLTPPTEGFSIVIGGGPQDVAPQATHLVILKFAPLTAGSYSSNLVMNEFVPPVPLTGTADELITSWTAPEVLDFGNVEIGNSSTLPLTITNSGDTSFLVAYSLETGCGEFELNTTSTYMFPPGTAYSVFVTFAPVSSGEFSCLLDLGETIPAIPLVGTSFNEGAGLEVSPLELAFPMTVAGYTTDRQVTVQNYDNSFVHIEPLLTPAGEFEIVSGGEPLDLAPGQSSAVLVQFAPQSAGFFDTGLSFGMGLPVVSISGESEEPHDACSVVPAQIDFGPVYLGNSQTRAFQVANGGNLPVVVSPQENSDSFIVDTESFTILPGNSVSIDVAFRPLSLGDATVEIDLGENICSSVFCSGTGVAAPSWELNNVGFTFDPLLESGFVNNTETDPRRPVTAYLVLRNPFPLYSLTGWECCARIEGPGSFLSWELVGSEPVNELEEPCFLVGLGEPRPPADYYLLATALIAVQSSLSAVSLHLDPVSNASISGQMAWFTTESGPQAISMYPCTGTSLVATINSESPPLGIGAPLPSVVATDESVTLSWTVGDVEFDGCRVYRRPEAGTAQVLNRELLPLDGRVFTFTDDTEGIAPGTVLFYSYALVSGDREIGRSLEVEVLLKALPPVTTRILQNVPNPFNPSTEIHFELQRAGPIRMTIYDVQGRLVRTLIDQNMTAGPHSETWRGEDDRGRRAPSGAYYIRLETNSKLDHRKIMLLK